MTFANYLLRLLLREEIRFYLFSQVILNAFISLKIRPFKADIRSLNIY